MARTIEIKITRKDSLEHGVSYEWEVYGNGFPVSTEDIVASLERVKFLVLFDAEFGVEDGEYEEDDEGEAHV